MSTCFASIVTCQGVRKSEIGMPWLLIEVWAAVNILRKPRNCILTKITKTTICIPEEAIQVQLQMFTMSTCQMCLAKIAFRK